MRRALGLAMALVVGLAGTVLAGAMYRNDSGAVARAVRVEFSEPAEITSMWPSFPQRDPQGPATVIVLSGGEIPAGGWFSFTWRPDSARVVKIEWFASPPSSARPNLGFSDPKAKPEVHGELLNPVFFAHPAYVMQGVSDRDEVFALPLHGVPELAFYPVLGDLPVSSLTWTFEVSHPEGIGTAIEDGMLYIWGHNPEWQGYGEVTLHVSAPDGRTGLVEIPVVVFCSDRTLVNPQGKKDYFVPWGVILDINRILSTEEHIRQYNKPDLGLLDRTLRFSRWRPMEFMRAVNCGTHWLGPHSAYGWTRERQFRTVDVVFLEVQRMGVNWIKIDPNWFTTTLTSTTVVPLYDWHTAPTWTEAEISYVVNEAHRLGISVLGSLQFWPLDDMVWVGHGRQTMRPADWEAWVRSYKDVTDRLARLYTKLGADMYCPGVELYNMAGELDHAWVGEPVARYVPNDTWNQSMIGVVRQARQAYPGPITWAEGLLLEKLEYSDSWGAIGRALALYREIDVMGVNHCADFFPFSELRDPSAEEVLSRWKWMVDSLLEPLASHLGRPLIFTEAAAASAPYDQAMIVISGREVDLNAQLMFYRGLVSSCFDQPWFFGAFWWDYPLTGPAGWAGGGGVWDPTWTFRLKPAQDYLETVYREGPTVSRLIRVDGVGDEWTKEHLLATDPRGDAPAGTPDIISLHGLLCEGYLFLYVGFAGTIDLTKVPACLFFIDFNGDGRVDHRIAVGILNGRHVATLQGSGSDSTTYGYADAAFGRQGLEIRLPLAYVDVNPSAVHVSFAMHAHVVGGGPLVWLDAIGHLDGRMFGPVTVCSP